MTIIAGFHVRNGILLAADTMYTGGSKVHEPKLFGYTLNANTPHASVLAFALAGSETYGKMAIEDCVDAVTDIPAASRTMKTVKTALRRVVKAINDEYVDKRPDPSERNDAAFDLIIGAWLPLAGGLQMFKTRGPAVLRAGNYHCAGSGWYLGDYLMRNMFSPLMSTRDAALLAIQAVSAAKTYDANCGGDTQFMGVYQQAHLSTLIEFDVQRVERYIADYDRVTRTLLFQLGDTTTTLGEFAGISPADGRFETQLSASIDEIRRIRAFWRNDGFKYLSELLKEFNPEGQQSPESTKGDPP